jgi:hypothetical protein
MNSSLHILLNEEAAAAMSVAAGGKCKSADDCIVSASRYKINSGAAVIYLSNDDDHVPNRSSHRPSR